MPGELAHSIAGVVAEKESSSDREPDVAYHVGIADITGKLAPVDEIELSLSAIDYSFVECDRVADAGVEQLIIIGVLTDVAAVDINIKTQFVGESFCEASFVVVSARRLHRQLEEVIAERRDRVGTGNEDVFKGGRLEDAVIR